MTAVDKDESQRIFENVFTGQFLICGNVGVTGLSLFVPAVESALCI